MLKYLLLSYAQYISYMMVNYGTSLNLTIIVVDKFAYYQMSAIFIFEKK